MVHQSNGQTLPLSRSWNRVYLMAGVERDDRLSCTAASGTACTKDPATTTTPTSRLHRPRRVHRQLERDRDNTVGVTLRNFLRSKATARRALNGSRPSAIAGHRATCASTCSLQRLRRHLVDYNRKRTVLSIGLSLVDW